MNKFCDTFISYGRADSLGFGRKLYARLLEEGFKIWFDQNDIPLGVDFQNQIDDGIEKAHNFLFIISPHSVNSPYCKKEIDLAIKHRKRIIPLLHVEQISRETWQQRFPNGTDEEWEAYKAQGKHTVFQNMHPTISKINWVYFREGLDDFEKSVTGLIDLFRRHADYVEQHTRFLAYALEWERHQKQHSYLLIADEKQQAKTWLQRRFKDEQPPCIPSDLHCEFITESIKNANNLMTQAIVSYADEDRATMEKIRNSLRRESITVWTNTTDIQTGEAFEEAIKRGIEQADNVVYLLSPDSVNSDYARQELEYALSLNKRIIPVLVRETSPEQVPSALRDLQYIDLTDNVKEEDYHLDESQLLRILHQDEAYYNEHKVLLTKALKWKRQHENPSILLRGYNLRSAQTWLKVANKRTLHPPTPLMEEFINESLRQPPATSLDVFISYSRADSDFARKLNDELQLQGKTTWFDQESIASGADFAQEIKQGIKACDNFLFILSPRSVNSPYCAEEVEYAASLNKRFVTLLHRQVNSDKLHPELAKVQWIDFNHNERDFNANFRQLVRTLDTDREHLRHHTKWSQRAIEWDSKDRSADLLLRGSELAVAEAWLKETQEQKKQPAATKLQVAYIDASKELQVHILKQEEERQQKEIEYERKQRKAAQKLTILISSAAIVTTGLSGLAGFLYRNSLVDQIRAYRASSEAELLSNQKLDALVSSLRTGKTLKHPVLQLFSPEASLQNQVIGTLRKVFYSVKERNRLEVPQGRLNNFVFNPDSKQLLISTVGADSTVHLWNSSGQQLAKPLEHQNQVFKVNFSRDGKLVATATEDGIIRLWDFSDKQLAQFKGHQGTITSMIFSPNSQQLATAGDDGAARLWDLSGRKIAEYKGTPYGLLGIGFSSNGRLLLAISQDYGNISLLELSGKQIEELKTQNKANILDITFSPDGKKLVGLYGEESGYAILWNLEEKSLLQPVELSEARSASFSADSQRIATAGSDGNVRLWDLHGYQLNQFQGHRGSVWNVIFSPDGKQLASSGADNTVRLWDLEDKQLKQLGTFKSEATRISLSPDAKQLATVSDNGTFRLLGLAGKQLAQFPQLQAKVNSISFSPDGQKLATALEDGTIALWDDSGQQLVQFQGHQGEAISVSFSPNGKQLATAGDNNTVRLWDLSGELLEEYSYRQYPIKSVSFSPDDKLLIASVGNYGDDAGKVFLSDSSGKQLAVFTAKQGEDINISFSTYGNIMATAGQYGMTKLWDLSGQELITFKGHQGRVNSTSFSVDGSTLATAGEDGTIKLWQVAGLDNLLSRGCNWVRDYLKSNAPEDDKSVCNGIN